MSLFFVLLKTSYMFLFFCLVAANFSIQSPRRSAFCISSLSSTFLLASSTSKLRMLATHGHWADKILQHISLRWPRRFYHGRFRMKKKKKRILAEWCVRWSSSLIDDNHHWIQDILFRMVLLLYRAQSLWSYPNGTQIIPQSNFNGLETSKSILPQGSFSSLLSHVHHSWTQARYSLLEPDRSARTS